jgi:hypothetical protein
MLMAMPKRKAGRKVQFNDDYHYFSREAMRLYREIRKKAKELRKT